MYLKGASEILSDKCTRHVVAYKDAGEDAKDDGEVETDEIRELERENISRTITFYAGQTLRTIAICYRDFKQWPPAGSTASSSGDVRYATTRPLLIY